MKNPKMHFSKDGITAVCGSATDTNWFTVAPDKVTCGRCQKSYDYMETVDAMTRPEGSAPRFTRPAYAKSKEKTKDLDEDSLEYQQAVKEISQTNSVTALKNANRQSVEVVAENEPLYELSYTVNAHRVTKADLIEYMETLLRAGASNIRLVQIRG